MKKVILIVITLFLIVACSQHQSEVKVEKLPPTKAADRDEVASSNEVAEEFIPEHIRRSKIEVVKHQ